MRTVAEIVNSLCQTWQAGCIAPRMPYADWFRHVFRERNKAADELANRAMDNGYSTSWANLDARSNMRKLCAHFDGGKRGSHAASCGWHLQCSSHEDTDGEPVWDTLAWGSVLLDCTCSSVDAELQGLVEATSAALSWAQHDIIPFEHNRVKFLI